MLIHRDGLYQFFNIGGKNYNCYCVMYKDKTVMIDCGPSCDRDAIEKNLQKDFIFGVDAIILTHAHGDSAGNAEYFSMYFNCPVYCMKISVDYVKKGTCKRPGKDHPYVKKAGAAGKVVGLLPAFIPYEACQAVEALTSIKTKELLGEDVSLLMTPGHTMDSLSLKIGDVALIGDAAQFNKRVLAPVFVDDEEQLGNTWETLLSQKCKYYLSAHGRAFSFEEWLKPSDQ